MHNEVASIPFSTRKAAIITGIALFTMAVAAGFGYTTVSTVLTGPAELLATLQKTRSFELNFRLGILSWLIVFLLDIVVSWSLYHFLAQVDKALSMLTAWIRIGYAAILAVALLNFIVILRLVSDDSYLQVFSSAQISALTLLFLNTFNGVWSLGLIVFGVHLGCLSYLLLRSRFVPKFLGILMGIAALSYLVVHTGYLIMPQQKIALSSLEKVLAVPMALSELLLAIWLLWKGGRTHSVVTSPTS
jgi:hypothetical protein